MPHARHRKHFEPAPPPETGVWGNYVQHELREIRADVAGLMDQAASMHTEADRRRVIIERLASETKAIAKTLEGTAPWLRALKPYTPQIIGCVLSLILAVAYTGKPPQRSEVEAALAKVLAAPK